MQFGCVLNHWCAIFSLSLCLQQCVMDPDTGEPKDELLPQIAGEIVALGCKLTKPSEIANQKVEVVLKRIQEGLDRANEGSVSRAQKVKGHVGTSVFVFSLLGGCLLGLKKYNRKINTWGPCSLSYIRRYIFSIIRSVLNLSEVHNYNANCDVWVLWGAVMLIVSVMCGISGPEVHSAGERLLHAWGRTG